MFALWHHTFFKETRNNLEEDLTLLHGDSSSEDEDDAVTLQELVPASTEAPPPVSVEAGTTLDMMEPATYLPGPILLPFNDPMSTSTSSSTSPTTSCTSMVNKKRRRAISPNSQTLEEPPSSRARGEPEKSNANYREVLAGESGQAKGS